ncbi:GGDEF domain-containing protein [Amycolatopsis sp.]|uniref:GGDEF domain-containing protein n=1 Tax=Amycolatopsis sp. TaxID=37632 RepID=UPI00260496A5|nr:GGDEF domain-containing protein [Amycolatopsis sp.]
MQGTRFCGRWRTRSGLELRAYDSFGRTGGEEFVLLLPEVSEAGARAVAERIRRGIARLEVIVTFDEQVTEIDGLSVSIGAAAYPGAGTAVDRVLHAADTAMYRAKANGRNQVVTATAA